MRGSLCRNMLDCPISQSAEIKAAKECFPLAQRNRSDSEVDFIHEAGPDVLLHRLDAATDLDVLCACRFPRTQKGILDAIRDKMECRAA